MPSIRAILKEHDHGQIEWDKLDFYRPKGQHRLHITDHRSYQDENGVWHVFPLFYAGKLAFVACPHCGNLHAHGWMPGNATPDCFPDKPNYEIGVTPCPEYDFCAKRFGKETENV